jgi:Mn-dependent DtxR family transcriptional regulator
MPSKPIEGLTEAQRNALRVYEKYIEKHGEPPTVRKLAAELKVNPNAAHYFINQLRDKGYLAARPITMIRPMLTRKGKRNT